MGRMDFSKMTPKEIAKAINLGKTTLAVIGLGHLGVNLACHFADANVVVFSVDINPDVVEKVNNGKGTFNDPQLAS